MSKAPTKENELHPDASERFERATAAVTKSPPQRRKAKKRAVKKSAKKIKK